MKLRTETPQDYKQIYELNASAFGRAEEAKLVERIRQSAEFIPELSIVAENDGHLTGHVLLSRAKTVASDAEEHEVIVLAPVAVRPELQKQGIGSRLIREGFDRAKKLGYGVVLLIGHPDYYPRLGFKPARSYGYELTQFKVRDEVFMVCEIIEGELAKHQGELRFPESFFG